MNASSKLTDPNEPQGEGPFLLNLPRDLRTALMTGGETETYAAGQAIPVAGPPAAPAVVLDGLARIFITTADGRQATLLYVRGGDCLGLAKSFGEDLPAEVEAVSQTRVRHFDRGHYEQALKTSVELTRAVAAELARNIGAFEASFAVFVAASVRRRVAFHILRMATPDREGRMMARVTQGGLARAVGSVREVVARAVRELRDEGVLLVLQGGLLVVDTDRLRRVADSDR
ncbi:MAG: family transcriptional regulator, cyclic receptor protein [Chloroflexota bacterium]|nr:family transcriptional regulator, cyclic receptor protein [Chloroflexota bacterium]